MTEEDKLKYLNKFYDSSMRGQKNITKVEMTDFLMNHKKIDISEIPLKLSSLRHKYMSEYFI